MKKLSLQVGDGWTRHPQSLLMPKFIEDGWEVHYIGDKRGIEHQEILKSGLDVTFHSIATGKLRRYFSWQNMLDVFKVGWGIVQSLFIMLRLRPQALFKGRICLSAACYRSACVRSASLYSRIGPVYGIGQ